MPQTIIRRVLINERDFPKMRYRCLVRSECGHKRLYDTCEWRPLTTQDYLIGVLKHGEQDKKTNSFNKIKLYLSKHYLYDSGYLREYEFSWNHVDELTGRKKHSRYSYRFGLATVTKFKT